MNTLNATSFYKIFEQSVADYHVHDDINQPMENPYPEKSLDFLLYKKNWIDTVQWHHEDLIREPNIDPVEGMKLKRLIDKSNQERTDLVEQIDEIIYNKYVNVEKLPGAGWNTESPAWAIDRLSILALKIYHMHQETIRKDAGAGHIAKCSEKLNILLQQKADLIASINELFADLEAGRKYMKVYKQMKMYNDEALNPVLYKQKQQD